MTLEKPLKTRCVWGGENAGGKSGCCRFRVVRPTAFVSFFLLFNRKLCTLFPMFSI